MRGGTGESNVSTMPPIGGGGLLEVFEQRAPRAPDGRVEETVSMRGWTGPAGSPGGDDHTMPLAVDLQGVHKSFGAVHAVRGIDLAVRPGEVVAFLGPNGAGKTSTIDMILGLSRPSVGEVEVYGMGPRQAISRGLVSAVMQSGGLLKDFTVAETVAYTARLFAMSRPVAEVLERAGIAGIAGRRVGKCSGGEQQRLRFAMALLPDPELLILDEPTQGMDVEGRRDFWRAILWVPRTPSAQLRRPSGIRG